MEALMTASKLGAIIVDIDGTIADLSDRLHHITGDKKDWDAFYDCVRFDTPIWPILQIVKAMENQWKVLFVTGRPERTRWATESWLKKHAKLQYKYEIFFREDGDYTQDSSIKREIYEEYIEPLYAVQIVLEDRDQVVKMWRSLGLRTLQVADGDF